ncbi:MAG: hypothetical protein ACTSRW_16245, partial [Candidatus Helarchaeota archaeon]
YLVIFGFVSQVVITIVGIIFVCFMAVGLAGWYIFPYLVMADIAHKDELETGEPRAAMYYGFSGLPLNVFQAVSHLLGIFIFEVSILNPPIFGITRAGGLPVSYGYIWWGVISSIFIIASYFIFRHVQIDFDFSKFEKKEKESQT